MATVGQIRRFRRILIYTALALLALFFLLLISVDRFVEPMLRKQMHTLIVKGSDSLYTYTLEDMDANFFDGRVEVRNLRINIDSSRYYYLKEHRRLPALTMELNLEEGSISGINLLALLFNKKLKLEEISSRKANINLARHLPLSKAVETDVPLWKSIRPDISSIEVETLRFEGARLLYRNTDTAESVELRFEECNAVFDDIRVDSASAFDTTRVGFARNIALDLRKLDFRTADSSYKMKAARINYSSEEKILSVDSFRLQPTLDRTVFYKHNPVQQTLYDVAFSSCRFVNTRLDRFFNNNVIAADSLVVDLPKIDVYLDRTVEPMFVSKLGTYPHQRLLAASTTIEVKNVLARDASLAYTEKSQRTFREGKVFFTDFDFTASNVTNNAHWIGRDPVCRASAEGNILGSSPFAVNFRFFLDSVNGCYEAEGTIRNVNSSQLNPASSNLADIAVNGLDIHKLDFNIRGRDLEARGELKMLYDNLVVTIRKTDDDSRTTTTRKFVTRLMNRYLIWPSNPGPDGVERVTRDAFAMRLAYQSFFGLLWKTIFDGMQDIMMKKG